MCQILHNIKHLLQSVVDAVLQLSDFLSVKYIVGDNLIEGFNQFPFPNQLGALQDLVITIGQSL